MGWVIRRTYSTGQIAYWDGKRFYPEKDIRFAKVYKRKSFALKRVPAFQVSDWKTELVEVDR